MSIRKRPEKAKSGLYLQSIIDEQEDIAAELNTFIKEFFLITYVGKESTIADYVYILQIGSVDFGSLEVTHPDLELTNNPKYWLENKDDCVLYQENHLIISSSNVPTDNILRYTVDDYQYGGKLERYHVWNIFDEFAMFLGLERFIDTGETNAELLKRCFLVFQNPANSTEKGLQNAILNCISNDLTVEREDIKIENPSEDNMWLTDEEYGSVYEHFVQLNRDIYRTKIWDTSMWEHNFKELEYISHQWDKLLDVYQDGTGQMGDLQVSLSQDESDTTDITVRGFKQDQATINEYFHKQNIRGAIDLSLKKYTDVLKPQNIKFKITATPAIQIDPTQIKIREQTLNTGTTEFDLQDIVTRTNSVSVVNPGLLEKDKEYMLIFRSPGDYSDMAISKLDYVTTDTTVSLLTEDRLMKFDDNGVLKYKDTKLHVSKISELQSYNNIADSSNGMILSGSNQEGTITLDVTGMGNSNLRIEHEGEMFDATTQIDAWTLNGLKINKDHELYSDSTIAADETAVLELDCMGFTYTLKKDTNQGAMAVKVWINGKINTSMSTTLTTPDMPVTRKFDKLTHVKIEFIKSGEYPVTIRDIKVTKYEIITALTYGEIIQGANYSYISDVPADRNNTLTITVKNYDVVSPVIKYIHIGPATTRATYTVKNITPTTDNTYLDIDTVCNVSLYEMVGATKLLITDNFVTKKYYENKSADDVAYLEIDVKQFSQIDSSSKRIYKTTRGSEIVSYIALNPGERVTTLSVTGTIYKLKALRTIKDLMGWEDRYNIYIAKNANGFIVKDTNSGEEWEASIARSRFTDADHFTYEGLPEGTIGFFCVNRQENVVSISETTDRMFEDTYISLQDSPEYIAYNELTIYKSVTGDTENITITNTFSPLLDMNQMMYYQISDIEKSDGLIIYARFKKFRYSRSNYFGIPIECRNKVKIIMNLIDTGVSPSIVAAALSELNDIYDTNIEYSNSLYARLTELLNDGYWSLGQKELYFAADLDFNNTQNYGTSISATSPIFSLSNEISLDRTLEINGESIDLAEYIITPPDNMTVLYDETGENIENGLIVSADGFNKLKFSNITDIEVVYVNGSVYSDYTLLKDEGIIVWNDIDGTANPIIGKFFSLSYHYKIPTGLKYKSLSSLYGMISYTVDAYLPVEISSKIPAALSDGDSFVVEFKEPVDYVSVPECSNSNFIATYKDGTVTVQRVFVDNVALLKTGYYYDDGKEYYFYNTIHADTAEALSNVKLHDVKKLDTIYQLTMATKNLIPNTSFNTSQNYDKLCYVDVDDPRVEGSGISKLNLVTACDTYNSWRSFNMVITFVEGINGMGLLFNPDDTAAYAVLDITPFIIPGGLVSLFATNGIELSIYQEEKVEGDALVKSIFAKPFTTFELVDNFYGWQVPKDLDTNYRYFLVVQGTGIVDDIVVKDNVSIDDQFYLHVRNVSNLDLDIEETDASGTLYSLSFDTDGNSLEQLEITRDGTIQIGTNIDYGLTKVFDSMQNFEDCITSTTVTRRKDMFLTTDKTGQISTPLFYVENSSAIVDLYVKVNNLLTDNMKYFNITGYVASTADDLPSETGTRKKTNLAHFTGSQIAPYLQFTVTAEPNRVIDSIEVYARYAEIGPRPLRIENYREGSIITKIYDLGAVNNYRLKRIVGKITQQRYCKLYMRGCKRNSNSTVWTNWYEVELNGDLEVLGYAHVFNNYKLLQFKFEFNSPRVTADIKEFIVEVV